MVLLYINSKIKQIDTLDKGRGFIATENLNKNEIVLIESPDCYIFKPKESPLFEILYDIICNNQIEQFNNLVPYNIIKLETKLINELKKIKNTKIKNKLNNFDDFTLSLLIKKYLQNAFNMDNSKKTIKPCILYYGAIFNHSCIPNVNFKFDFKKNQMIFYTNKYITKNEELFDNYTNINLNYKIRQSKLFHQYNFICKCLKCQKESNIFLLK